AGFERDLGAGDQVLGRAGDDDLAGRGFRGYSRRDVHGDAADVVAHPLHLARVQSGAHLEAERLHGGRDGQRTSDRTSGAIETGHEAVSGGAVLTAAITGEFAPDNSVIALQADLPGAVAKGTQGFRRVRDIDEEHGREDPVVHLDRTDASDE